MRVVWALLIALGFCASSAAAADELHAGVAVVDITPPPGYRMAGYFNERFNTGTHDPLQAKALVLRQGEHRGALVFCDLVSIALDVSAKARELAEGQTGIPAGHILVHATHSHTGPLYQGAMRDYFHAQAIAKSGTDAREAVDYSALLSQRIADAVEQASRQLRPVALQAGTGRQRGLSFNRRFHMQDGTVRFNPGKLNRDIIRPAGPIDPDVGMLLVKSPDGKQNIAGLTIFALHLDTVGGTEYSADYPFYLERTLRQDLGAGFVSLFGIGTCGDINHVDVTSKSPQKGQEEAARIGTALAETVIGELPGLKPLSHPSFAVRRAVVEVPAQKYGDDEVAQARAGMAKIGSREMPFLDQVKTVKIVSLQGRPEKLPLEIQVFRLSGDTAIVGLPGEVFVELGLAIKQASPFERTFVIELCNDGVHYVPTKKAFAEGSYETVNSLITPGGGEQLVETAVRLLKELK
jgi:neutral ceramidase